MHSQTLDGAAHIPRVPYWLRGDCIWESAGVRPLQLSAGGSSCQEKLEGTILTVEELGSAFRAGELFIGLNSMGLVAGKGA